MENKNQENWKIFKDRVESLLERWEKFGLNHESITSKELITGFLSEVNDGYTEQLIK